MFVKQSPGSNESPSIWIPVAGDRIFTRLDSYY